MDATLDLKVDEGWEPYTVLAVSGEIDVGTAPRLREKILELVGLGVSQLVLDMTGVDFLDSTGLGVLVGALKRLRSANATSAWSASSRVSSGSSGSPGSTRCSRSANRSRRPPQSRGSRCTATRDWLAQVGVIAEPVPMARCNGWEWLRSASVIRAENRSRCRAR